MKVVVPSRYSSFSLFAGRFFFSHAQDFVKVNNEKGKESKVGKITIGRRGATTISGDKDDGGGDENDEWFPFITKVT